MDSDHYPTDAELDELRNWSINRSHMELVEWLEDRWKWPDYIRRTQRRLYIATGGWSGHEELLYELERSPCMFWSAHWELSKRGGLHVFSLSNIRRWDASLRSAPHASAS